MVIHPGALGDVVLSLPALRRLKRESGVSLSLLCVGTVGGVIQDLGLIDEHLALEGRILSGMFQSPWNRETRRLCRDYDVIVIIGRSRSLADSVKENHGGAVCWVTPRPPYGVAEHVAVHVLKGFRDQGLLVGDDDLPPVLTPDDTLDGFCRGGGAAALTRYFVLHPGSGSKRKQWAVERVLDVARMASAKGMGMPVFLIGPAEKGLLPILAKRLGTAIRLAPSDLADLSEATRLKREATVTGKFYFFTEDLHRVVSLLCRSACLVCNDSGVAHLAAFLGVPTVALFGPSSPFRWSPIGKRVVALRGVRDCPPCFETTQTNCDDPQCLTGISPANVVEAMEVVQRRVRS